MKYRCVSDHAEDLSDGRVVGPGEFIDLTEDDVRDGRTEQLIADGRFIAVEDEAEHEAKLAKNRVKSRQSASDEGEGE